MLLTATTKETIMGRGTVQLQVRLGNFQVHDVDWMDGSDLSSSVRL